MSLSRHAAYSWNFDTNSGRFKRLLGGGELIEDVWNFYKHGEQNLFIGVYVNSTKSLDAATLLNAARKAWISTRWDIPSIATQILHEPREGSPMPSTSLVYTPAKSLDEVRVWADETVVLKEGAHNLDDLRAEVGAGTLPTKDLMDQTYLYVAPVSATTFGLLLRTTHVPFDGTGLKVLATAVLEHLSKYVSSSKYEASEHARLKWGSEGDNLLPVANDLTRGHEPAEVDAAGNTIKPELAAEVREGPQYDACLNEIMTNLAKGGQIAHPFKSVKTYDPSVQAPANRRAQYVFSVEDSDKLVGAGARIADERLTVNHLAHGTLSLLTAIDNPPEPGSPNVVFYYGLVNTRQRLRKEYRDPFAYPGYCLSMSAIQIPVSLVDKYGDSLSSNLKDAIIDFAKAVKREYAHQAAYPSFQAIAFDQVNMMLSAPPPPPWLGPWFSGDGHAAIYLRPTYPSNSVPVLDVDDFFLGLNKTDPGPFFRIWEWKGRIVLSADYNMHAVEPSIVDGWMKKWADLLLLAAA